MLREDLPGHRGFVTGDAAGVVNLHSPKRFIVLSASTLLCKRMRPAISRLARSLSSSESSLAGSLNARGPEVGT